MTSMRRAYCFYDGECGLCQSAIRRFGWGMRALGVTPIPLQGSPLDQPGLSDWLLSEMKVWTGHRLLGGSYAVAWMCSRSWLSWPFYIVLNTPPISAIGKAIYRRIAATRHCDADGSCRLPQG